MNASFTCVATIVHFRLPDVKNYDEKAYVIIKKVDEFILVLCIFYVPVCSFRQSVSFTLAMWSNIHVRTKPVFCLPNGMIEPSDENEIVKEPIVIIGWEHRKKCQTFLLNTRKIRNKRISS